MHISKLNRNKLPPSLDTLYNDKPPNCFSELCKFYKRDAVSKGASFLVAQVTYQWDCQTILHGQASSLRLYEVLLRLYVPTYHFYLS